MGNLKEIVVQYLTMETNYALLITGDWGTGKTYYYKNILEKRISETPVYKDNSKNYKPIRISLFGLKSIEEIQYEIFMGLYPFLKGKQFTIGATILKYLTKGILTYKGMSEYANLFEGIDKSVNSLYDREELLLCFDDLERISDSLKIEQLIGFINSIVENTNTKILIIANEQKIAKGSQTKYNNLKDKIIGNTIYYNPCYDDIYESVISKFKGSSSTYYNFLKSEKKLIQSIFFTNSSNLRILIFALNYYQLVYSETELKLGCDEELKQEILEELLKFSLAISIEYWNGDLSFKERKSLDLRFHIRLNRNDSTNQPTYKDGFLKKYGYSTPRYFDSVFNYITGGEILNFEKLYKDLKNIYHFESSEVPRHYQIYNKLTYPKCLLLTDKEYLGLTNELVDYIFQGKFELSHIPTAFFYSLRFGNPLSLDIPKFERRVIKSIWKWKDNFDFNNSIHFDIDSSDKQGLNVNIDRIKAECHNLFKNYYNENKFMQIRNLEKLFYQDFDKFYDTLFELDYERIVFGGSVFDDFNPQRVFKKFKESSPETRYKILGLFYAIYKDPPASIYEKSLPFLEALLEKLKSTNEIEIGKNVKGYIFKRLHDYIEEAIYANKKNKIFKL